MGNCPYTVGTILLAGDFRGKCIVGIHLWGGGQKADSIHKGSAVGAGRPDRPGCLCCSP